MGRPQFGLPRLRTWATGIAIGPDHTPPWVTLQQNPRTVRAWFPESGGTLIFSGNVAVSVEMQHTGDPTQQREVAAVIELPDVVNGADVGVIQRRSYWRSGPLP